MGLDRSVVDSLKRLDAGDNFFLQLLEVFERDAQRNLAIIQTGFAERAPAQVELASHAIKGTAANVGALGMSRVAGEIERLIRSGDIDGARPLLRELEAEFATTRADIAAERQQAEEAADRGGGG